jgi:hypothetical protein
VATPLAAAETLALPAALAAATLLAATPWLHSFDVRGTTGLLVVAAWAPVVVGTLLIRVWRQPPAVSYSVSAVCLLLLLVAVAGMHPSEIWRSLVDSPNRLLTETLPLGGPRVTLAVPLVLTWTCGAAATELVMRSRRGDSAMAAIGLAVPVGCFVLAYAVGASRPGRSEVAGPLLLVTLVLVAVLRHVSQVAAIQPAASGPALEEDARPVTWKPGAAGALTAASLAVALALLVPNLPSMSGTPASFNRAAPLTTAVVIDPVDAMALLRDSKPSRPVLHLVTDRPSSGYLAMAILDHYDGGIWRFNTTFEPTGGRVPSAPAGSPAPIPGAPVANIGQRATVLTPLPLPLLPVLDRPVRVRGVNATVDGATGMLLSRAAASRAGTYSVVSAAPIMTLGAVPPGDGVGTAAGLTSPATAADLAVPAGSQAAVGKALSFLSTISGRRPAPTVGFLQAGIDSLHADEGWIDPTAPPTGKHSLSATKPGGTSLAEVISAVTITRSATPEQFATFLAVTARYLGVPARVVTGFRAESTSSPTVLPAGDHVVTNRQAWTWVEIPVSGLGWVVADPTPDQRVPAPMLPPESAQPAQAQPSPPQANAVPANRITGGHAVAKPAPINLRASHHFSAWLLALIVAAGAALVAALVGPAVAAGRRLSRRRARRRGDAPALAVGAWLEVLDSLQQAGMVAGAGATSAEVAAEAGRHFGPEVAAPIQDVGDLAERAVFCHRAPPDEDDADRAWVTQRTVRRTVHRDLDRRGRWRAWLAVGSAPRLPVLAAGKHPDEVTALR